MNLTKRISGVDISKYVFEPKTSDQTPEKISQLTQKIEEMGGPKGTNAFPYEKKALERLCLARASLEYPTLDLSFLDMVQTIDTNGFKVTVPRFAVFPVYSTGKIAVCYEDSEVNYYYYAVGQEQEEVQEDLPTIFSKHIDRGMKNAENPDDGWLDFNIGDIILPSETRERIQLAESSFRRENLYMISEAKPSNWEFKDPLVVGVIADQCFLIDKFDPTPIEDYVSREFIK